MEHLNVRIRPRWYMLLAFLLLSTVSLWPRQSVTSADGFATEGMRVDKATTSQENIEVTGVVMSETGEEMPGVSVLIKGTSTGTITDLYGKYRVTVPSHHTVLQFSFIGYKTLEETVNNRKVINVKFEEIASELEEVVVVGYGSQKKVSLVGSVSTVEVKSLASMSSPSLSSTLGGQLPGIITRQAIGEPGYDQASVYIRGMGTWGERSPLVLIDGVERNMNYINTEEIESISVLKDASATAVYGVRGANGVILINTKSGQKGKPKISFRTEFAMQTPLRLADYIDGVEYAQLVNEARYNVDSKNYQPRYTENDIELYRNGSDPYLHPNVDWQDEVLRKHTFQTINNLNISGGSDVIRYFMNVGYTMQNGMYKVDNLNKYNTNTNINRYNFRSKVDITLSKRLEVSLGVGGIIQVNNFPATNSYDFFGSLGGTNPIVFPKHNPDGSIGGGGSWYASNPWGVLTQSGYINKSQNVLQGTFGAKWDLSWILPGLSASGKFAYDHYYEGTTTRSKKFEVKQYLGKDDNGEDKYQLLQEPTTLGYGVGNASNRSVYMEGSLNYSGQFGLHGVNAMILGNRREYVDNTAGNSTANLPYRSLGMAARVSYDYDHRYLLEYNMGYNGSENFPEGKRFGLFPSVSLGWVISNEKWWKLDAISNFKIRGSLGQVGNDRISQRFLFLTTMKTNGAQSYMFGYDPQTLAGIEEMQMGNNDVTWEISTKMNIGVDLGFFNNSLTLQVDAFKEWRDGILMQRKIIPTITGFYPWVVPYGNLGKTENMGMDALVEFKRQTKSGFFYSLRANVSYARNKIIENDEPHKKWAYQSEKGLPIDQPFGLIAMGFFADEADIANSPKQLFQSTVRPGDIKYKDVNGDEVIDTYDRVAIGHPRTPELMFGFGGTVAYKNFDFTAYFTGATRTSVFLGSEDIWAFKNGEGTYNINREYYDNRWTPETASTAKYPLVITGDSPNNYQLSTLYMRDASYLRLKNVELGYMFKTKALKDFRIESVRLFTNATNVLTFDKLKIMDPEANNTKSYPLQCTWNFGLQANF